LRFARPAEDRIVRFRKVLKAAQHVPRYRECLRRANLHSNRSIAALRCIEEALAHFAVLDLDQFRGSREEYSSARAPIAPPQRFFRPLERPSRIAVLMEGFEEKSGVRIFGRDSSDLYDSLRQYEPEVIAGPVSVLRRLVSSVDDGTLSLPLLRHAIVAFTGIDEVLDLHDRDVFWRTFQVPLFEHYAGLDGRVIARECEIHEGLHLVEEHAVIERHERQELLLTSLTDFRQPTLRLKTGYAGAIEKTLCECGRVEPRVLALTPLQRDSSRLTASAA